MTSVVRSFAQRNNNVNQITPQFAGILPNTDISGAALYALNIPVANVQNPNGVYYVDLSGVDMSGSLLNVGGLFYPFAPNGDTLTPISIITFAINAPVQASYFPGMEFTIFFRNIPFNRLPGPPLLTVGIVSQVNGPPFPYIVSPPFPSRVGANVYPSITLKSDGTNFNVVSSGPAGWMGIPALSVVLAAYDNFGPL